MIPKLFRFLVIYKAKCYSRAGRSFPPPLLWDRAFSRPAPRTNSKSPSFRSTCDFWKANRWPPSPPASALTGSITVRKGGHVEPDRVRQDLPKLVAILRRKGLDVPMVTTDIADTESPFADDILSTMAELGIRHYRWNGFRYDTGAPIGRQLDLKPRVAKLAALNARHKVTAMYHTHSGVGLVGASFWDLHILLDGLDPDAVGVNYDVGHATVEGGLGGWINSFNILLPHLRGVAVKDFYWAKNAAGGGSSRNGRLSGGGQGRVLRGGGGGVLPVHCSCTSNIRWEAARTASRSSPSRRMKQPP